MVNIESTMRACYYDGDYRVLIDTWFELFTIVDDPSFQSETRLEFSIMRSTSMGLWFTSGLCYSGLLVMWMICCCDAGGIFKQLYRKTSDTSPAGRSFLARARSGDHCLYLGTKQASPPRSLVYNSLTGTCTGYTGNDKLGDPVDHGEETGWQTLGNLAHSIYC